MADVVSDVVVVTDRGFDAPAIKKNRSFSFSWKVYIPFIYLFIYFQAWTSDQLPIGLIPIGWIPVQVWFVYHT